MTQPIAARATRYFIAACLSGLAAFGTAAQAFPDRPITLVVPYAPGGAGDIIGRTVAKALTEVLGETVIVENKPGAGGNIGAGAVARAPDTDGHTLLLGATSLASNPSLMKNMTFDPRHDLVAIGGVASLQNVVVVRQDMPVTSVEELVRYARENPGKLTFGTAGVGTSSHLSVELFKSQVGVDLLHVPYRSGAPALNDMMAGNLDMAFELMPAVLSYLQAERLRGLAVTGAERSPTLPNMPTLAESGVKDYDFVAWFGIFAPAGMSPQRRGELNEIVNAAIDTPAFKAQMQRLGADPMPGTHPAFAAFFAAELDRWAALATSANLPTVD